jgi:hypothetical protein
MKMIMNISEVFFGLFFLPPPVVGQVIICPGTPGGRWQRARRSDQTYLDLIGDDGPWAELCADLVCPDRIKVYKAQGFDVTVALHILEIPQSSHITLIGVVLPIKLRGDARNATRGVSMHKSQKGKCRETCRKSSWRVRIRVMRSLTAVSTVARDMSVCLKTHHLVPPRTVRGGRCS